MVQLYQTRVSKKNFVVIFVCVCENSVFHINMINYNKISNPTNAIETMPNDAA